jgi:tetratricopeptide (TPR) repeat protein
MNYELKIMNMRKNICKIVVGIFLMTMTLSCDDFLDDMPDNRAELDSREKVVNLLTSAYAGTTYYRLAEFSSDNIDDHGNTFSQVSVLNAELLYWADAVGTDGNDNPVRVWAQNYTAISVANTALQAIEEIGNDDGSMNPQRGEALLCRAYCHFVLVNLFALHYNPATASSDLGITYMEAPETTLNPQYERNSVAEVYEKIERDILEGLPLIKDAEYSVPKYHFNRNAALAFATRFFLYKGEWEKVIQYADELFAGNPSSYLRDWPAIVNYTADVNDRARKYVGADENANFLIKTAHSVMGQLATGYTWSGRYRHGARLAEMETYYARAPWGLLSSSSQYKWPIATYNSANQVSRLVPRMPRLFEYTDPVAGVGYVRTVTVEFWAEETLLARAEAYIMLGRYNEALADLNMWRENVTVSSLAFTVETVNLFFNGINYYDGEAYKPTIKHKLNPASELYAVSSDKTKENMIHLLLYCRRLETLSQGMRWFDVKRWGIDIFRYTLDANSTVSNFARDVVKLPHDDPRRALQIPDEVRVAGYTPNPR